MPVHLKNKKESLLHGKKNFVREESKPTMRDCIEDNQSELDSYLTYLFNQINNNSEIPLESLMRGEVFYYKKNKKSFKAVS
ncbi:hypothetical protein ACLHDF_08045 [Priestia aryabhattai]|uniref:hypothetical protein n=1 Tax=Priestia megaterium TaxID=1404 RepID=UPI0039B8597A